MLDVLNDTLTAVVFVTIRPVVTHVCLFSKFAAILWGQEAGWDEEGARDLGIGAR